MGVDIKTTPEGLPYAVITTDRDRTQDAPVNFRLDSQHKDNQQMLDITKPVQVRDGRKVRIICTDASTRYEGKPQPLVGIIEDCNTLQTWGLDGKYYPSVTADYELDLINVPPPKKKVKVQVYLKIWKGKPTAYAFTEAEGFDNSVKGMAEKIIEMEYDEVQP